MADERSAHAALRPHAVVKDEWILKAYDEFPVDVVNVSSQDLRYFSSILSKKEFARRSDSQPVLKRLVSANTISESAELLAPAPFVVREVAARELDGPKTRRVRLAFIGLTETTPPPPAGLKFIDTIEAAKRALPEARKSAEVVIVLAKVSAEEATRIARGVPDIDVMIVGNGVTLEQVFTPPFYVGKTLIAFTPFETRMLGELRFYRNAQGGFTTRPRFITLDEAAVPAHPAAKQLADAASKAEIEAQDESKKLLEDWLANSRPVSNKPPQPGIPAYFVGGAACSQCHLSQYMKWANGPHARATDSLPARSVEFDASCLACHATGAKADRGRNQFMGFQAVQCEQCHGPGSDHAAKPAKGYGRASNMLAGCASCHNPETSPGFNLQTAWEKIKH
ncbi:MAG TPA: multiheme c-type cytochrome [Blastocatellia bacterium]|nr:multiheme c-type cytochrome [Blastocatellia bacterium]